MKYKVTLKFTNHNGTHEKRTYTVEAGYNASNKDLGQLAFERYYDKNPDVMSMLNAKNGRPWEVDKVRAVVKHEYGVDPTGWNPDPEGWGYTAAHDMGV